MISTKTEEYLKGYEDGVKEARKWMDFAYKQIKDAMKNAMEAGDIYLDCSIKAKHFERKVKDGE